MNRIGKKGRAWMAAKQVLKKLFLKAGIITCELKYKGCWYDNALGFAHRLKRRKIVDDDELHFVILACNPCHNKIEYLPPEEMFRIVTAIREARPL